MQASADYYGLTGLRAVEALNANNEHLPRNVNPEADTAFMRALDQEDYGRYVRLAKTLRQAARQETEMTPERESAPEMKRKMAAWYRAAKKRAMRTGELPNENWKWCPYCHEPFKPRVAANEYCSPKCKARAAKTGPQAA